MITTLVGKAATGMVIVSTTFGGVHIDPAKLAMKFAPQFEELAEIYSPPSLPESGQRIKTIKVFVTAYSSTPDQTDASPFITANGTVVRDGLVAANFLPFGVRVRFPELYGDKEFVVADRMNARYNKRIDIWVPTRAQAKQFGKQYLDVEIIPPEVTVARR